ncbi:MAG TPA: hypothetical protein VHC47_13455 [Mucilaginibacter sp.]|nr:hypothetical protein [Mucilaginibacter sp.]
MADLETACRIALSQPEAEEFDHFDHPAFRVKGKRYLRQYGQKKTE